MLAGACLGHWYLSFSVFFFSDYSWGLGGMLTTHVGSV